jgi:hypothetical protein
MRFYQSYILNTNPNGAFASIDYFHKLLLGAISMRLDRNPSLSDNPETSKAYLKITNRQVIVLMKFSLSCSTLKKWIMCREEISPYAIEAFKLDADGIGLVSIGSKFLSPERPL